MRQSLIPDSSALIVSDHPGNQHRVAALKQHFRENPSAFAPFSTDARAATRSVVPKNATEVFLR